MTGLFYWCRWAGLIARAFNTMRRVESLPVIKAMDILARHTAFFEWAHNEYLSLYSRNSAAARVMVRKKVEQMEDADRRFLVLVFQIAQSRYLYRSSIAYPMNLLFIAIATFVSFFIYSNFPGWWAFLPVAVTIAQMLVSGHFQLRQACAYGDLSIELVNSLEQYPLPRGTP